MTIRLGKYYRTRGGNKARVICLDVAGNAYPTLVLIDNGYYESIYSMTTDGRMPSGNIEDEHDLISEWIEKPEFDWSNAAAWHVAIAMDEDGEWLAYNDVPEPGEGVWCCCKHLETIPPEHAPKWTGDWDDSLIIRPGHEQKEESKES